MAYVYKGTQRDAAESGTAPATPLPGSCGTRSGYRRHHRRGEDACRPCKDANTARALADRGRTPRNLMPCGTRAAYRRHLNAGTTPCAPCNEANNEYSRKSARKLAGVPELARRPDDGSACGTYAGSMRHRRRGTVLCRGCRDAYNAVNRAYKAACRERKAA